ncbi:TPA: hypothetical protein N0F65_001416 [Lagenidium giganteum]|uniref:Aspartylglucosaminidase n=1 Tax=Lagenidium giganteum TaxID=4803 RepID=A0AAV2Z0J7_9STRA|nr:TPA: hypothetical protein N0F65_001416 [Lagenidium giganteum]
MGRRIGAMWVVATTVMALFVWCVQGAVVINTWPFTHATSAAFRVLSHGADADSTVQRNRALDAVVAGCQQCEEEQCDFTVGYGGSPDTTGETTLDAMILDGTTKAMWAVARLRRVKGAIQVARAVMEHSAHSILAGDGATAFAKMMGFTEESLSTPSSQEKFAQWRAHQCQPNYYRNVQGQNSSCPPYKPLVNSRWSRLDDAKERSKAAQLISETNHDTIGMIVLTDGGHIAAGTSSNGANHKIAGRVGDAAVPGAGAYADSAIGGAACTGDGDVMMRFLPSFHAVLDMANGLHPQVACEKALIRIAKHFPDFKGGIVCLNRLGAYGGAGHGWDFSFTVQATGMAEPSVVHVAPISLQ